MIPGKVYTPRDVIEATWRRRWWIAIPFLVIATAAFVYVMSLSYNYRSAATLQVLPEPVSETYIRSMGQTREVDRLSSIGQGTLTRQRLEQIISDFDLYPEMRRTTVMENVINTVRSQITFEMTDRDLFLLGFTAKDPRVAHAVATRLSSLFLEENARDRGQRADATKKFLETQLESSRTRLEEMDKRLEAYRLQYAGQLPSQLDANVQELNNTQLQLRTLLESVNRDRDQRLFIQRQSELARTSDDVGLSTPAAAGMRSTAGGDAAMSGAGGDIGDLDTARANLKALELRLTPEHPDVQRMKRLVARLEQSATGTAAASSPSSRRRDLRTREFQGQIEIIDRQMANKLEEERRLRARIAEYSTRIDAVPVRESELTSLTRDYEDTKKQYSSLLGRQQEASMAANLESKAIGDRFRVIDPARLPEKPFSPSRRNYLLLALVAALGFAFSLAAMVEYRDSSVRTDEDITVSLGLPVLATIPILHTAASGGSTRGRRR